MLKFFVILFSSLFIFFNSFSEPMVIPEGCDHGISDHEDGIFYYSKDDRRLVGGYNRFLELNYIFQEEVLETGMVVRIKLYSNGSKGVINSEGVEEFIPNNNALMEKEAKDLAAREQKRKQRNEKARMLYAAQKAAAQKAVAALGEQEEVVEDPVTSIRKKRNEQLRMLYAEQKAAAEAGCPEAVKKRNWKLSKVAEIREKADADADAGEAEAVRKRERSLKKVREYKQNMRRMADMAGFSSKRQKRASLQNDAEIEPALALSHPSFPMPLAERAGGPLPYSDAIPMPPHFGAIPMPMPPHFGAIPIPIPIPIPMPMPPHFGAMPLPPHFGAMPLPPHFGAMPLPPHFGVIPMPPHFGVMVLPPYFDAMPTETGLTGFPMRQ